MSLGLGLPWESSYTVQRGMGFPCCQHPLFLASDCPPLLPSHPHHPDLGHLHLEFIIIQEIEDFFFSSTGKVQSETRGRGTGGSGCFRVKGDLGEHYCLSPCLLKILPKGSFRIPNVLSPLHVPESVCGDCLFPPCLPCSALSPRGASHLG